MFPDYKISPKMKNIPMAAKASHESNKNCNDNIKMKMDILILIL